jgi:hypothetical protein
MTGIPDDDVSLPRELTLSQNYPNPFNPNTRIRFALPVRSHVGLRIYDILGRAVVNLADDVYDAGYHEVIWDGRNSSGENAASGIYFYRLDAGGKSISRKMVILK